MWAPIPNTVMYIDVTIGEAYWWQPDPIDTGGSGAGEN